MAATTAYKDIYPKFLALESQGPEPLATSFWQDFDKAGCKVLRERPMMVTADGRGMVLQSRVPLVAFAVLGQLSSSAGCDRQTTRALAVITTVR